MAESRDPDELLDVWRGLAHHLAADAAEVHALRRAGQRRARASWASPTSAPCGARTTTCRPTPSPRSSTGCGSRCSRSTTSLHAYVRAALREAVRRRQGARATARSPPTCSATCGRRSGATSTRWWRPPTGDPGYDLDAAARRRRSVDAKEMVQLRRALLHLARASRRCPRPSGSGRCSCKPRDRDVVCHASAWDVDNDDDLRIKMCIEVNAEDFVTIHHELGHNFYQRAYNKQPLPVPQQRQRRLPRGHRRHHRAVGDARSTW